MSSRRRGGRFPHWPLSPAMRSGSAPFGGGDVCVYGFVAGFGDFSVFLGCFACCCCCCCCFCCS